MSALAFDTLATLNKLTTKGGFSKKAAESLVDILKDTHDEVATKSDLDLLHARVHGEIQAMYWKLAATFVVANGGLLYFTRGMHL